MSNRDLVALHTESQYAESIHILGISSHQYGIDVESDSEIYYRSFTLEKLFKFLIYCLVIDNHGLHIYGLIWLVSMEYK